jgi:8-oxo-dGTP pyrophosphatase MutT (NUDIX family)
MLVKDPIKQQRVSPILVVGSSRLDADVLKAVRAERLARRIMVVTAAEDTHCSAKAIVMNQLGQVLVLKDAGGKWHDLPGGRIHEGEDAVTGLAREVREETGLSIGDIQLGETINFKAGKVPHTTLLFKATALTLDVQLSTEHSDHAWVEPKDLGDYALGLLLAPMQRLLKPTTIQAQDATPDNHHETARKTAEKIYKAAAETWLAQLNADLVAALFGHKMMDYDGVWFDVYGAAAGGWVAVMAEAAERARKATAQTLAAHEGVENTPDKDALKAFAASRKQPLEAFSKAVREKVAASLKRGVAGGESAKALARRANETFGEISDGAVKRVAATEAQVTYGVSQAEALALAGYQRKRWVTRDDELVRESHVLCGEQGAIPINSSFQNGLKHPGDINGPPEEVINCRCWLEGA